MQSVKFLFSKFYINQETPIMGLSVELPDKHGFF